MGDVILSLPTLQAWRANFPDAFIGFVANPSMGPFLAKHPAIDAFISTHDSRGLPKEVSLLASELRTHQFDQSVSLLPNFTVDRALRGAGISKRVGLRNKWFTYVLYTQSLRQKRSRVEKHEAQYNADLAMLAGLPKAAVLARPFVELDETLRESATQRLRERGLLFERSVLIHPGMGGSALNWDLRRYVELGAALKKSGQNVCFSFGPMDQALETKARELWSKSSADPFVAFVGREGSLPEFMTLLTRCSLVIAPSTGPLHLANALNVPFLGIYPPITVQHPRRWGPWGAERGKVLMPQVECPARYDCLGSACSFFPCMELISVTSMLREALDLLNKPLKNQTLMGLNT